MKWANINLLLEIQVHSYRTYRPILQVEVCNRIESFSSLFFLNKIPGEIIHTFITFSAEVSLIQDEYAEMKHNMMDTEFFTNEQFGSFKPRVDINIEDIWSFSIEILQI